MKKIKILGRDCFIATLLAMTLLCGCDGTDGNGYPDADACCDSDAQPPDGTDDGEAVLAILTVESTPVSGATIELNGTPSGEVTPASFEHPVGHYTIQLTLADYDAAPEEVDLPAEGTTVIITLYPSVEGNWDLTFRNTETGTEGRYTLYLEQTGDLLIGWDDLCEYTGSTLATAEISLFRSNCSGGPETRTLIGSRVTPNRLEGNWNSSGISSGTWWATR